MNNIGTLVTAAIRPASDLDTFPSAYANELLGGHYQVATINDRNSIPNERRVEGMFCSVAADGNVYKLSGGTANGNWAIFSGGGNTDAGQIISGTLADARLSANVTLQGNTFNISNKLVKLDATGKLVALDGSALTGLTKSQVGLGNLQNIDTTNAANISSGILSLSRLTDFIGSGPTHSRGLVPDPGINVGISKFLREDGSWADLPATVTLQGNTFNGANQLVKTDGAGKLPAIDGSQLTNIPKLATIFAAISLRV